MSARRKASRRRRPRCRPARPVRAGRGARLGARLDGGPGEPGVPVLRGRSGEPRSDACKAAVSAGGTQALYDWNGIRIGDANGRHQELIPDGKLCSSRQRRVQGARPGALRLARDEREQWLVHLQVPGDRPPQGHVQGLRHEVGLRPVAAAGLGRPRPGAPGRDGHRPGGLGRLLHVLRHPPGALRQAAPVRGLAALGQPGSLLLLLRCGVRGHRWRQGLGRRQRPGTERLGAVREADRGRQRQVDRGAPRPR